MLIQQTGMSIGQIEGVRPVTSEPSMLESNQTPESPATHIEKEQTSHPEPEPHAEKYDDGSIEFVEPVSFEPLDASEKSAHRAEPRIDQSVPQKKGSEALKLPLVGKRSKSIQQPVRYQIETITTDIQSEAVPAVKANPEKEPEMKIFRNHDASTCASLSESKTTSDEAQQNLDLLAITEKKAGAQLPPDRDAETTMRSERFEANGLKRQVSEVEHPLAPHNQSPVHFDREHIQQTTLRDIRKWVADSSDSTRVDLPISDMNQAVYPEDEISSPIDRHAVPVSIAQKPIESQKSREPDVQDFQLSIGTIKITVEEPQSMVPPQSAKSNRPTKTPSPASSSTRLSRHYIRI
jgi:hypothetical protein